MKRNTPADFWARVQVGAPDECWPWTAKSKDPDGYGIVRMAGKQYRTHRFAYAEANGPIPDGMCVCHSCDNPPCCNPAHLWLGSNADNTADRDAKGRGDWSSGDRHWTRRVPGVMAGENSPTHKLTWPQVREIRAAYSAGEGSQRVLGLRYGVTREAIRSIVQGKNWKETA